MSHAIAHESGIAAHGLWSISRDLARGLKSRKEYEAMMYHADTPCQNDLDGRGHLSQRALADFTLWFMRILDCSLRELRKGGYRFDFLLTHWTYCSRSCFRKPDLFD
jgi:hypothetical protein